MQTGSRMCWASFVLRRRGCLGLFGWTVNDEQKPEASRHDALSDRRGFLASLGSVVIGGFLMVVPLAAGLVTFLSPVWKKRSGGATGSDAFVRVGSLDALPPDGVPRKFTVIADQVDAWTRRPQVPVGAIYLRRTDDKTVQAFNVICPHAGCFVNYRPDRGGYLCPCHDSTFAVDGEINDPKSPSPRGMDPLAVEIRGQEIWVRFQNFKTGHADRVPMV